MKEPGSPQWSAEWYRGLFELTAEGVWIIEPSEPVPISLPEDEQIERFYRVVRLVDCNPALAAMYGLESPSQLLGAQLGDLLPAADPHNLEYLRAFIRSGYRLTDAESHELDAEGNPKYFLNNLFGFIQDGCLVRACGTQRDITHQKAVEAELRRKVEELQTLMETLPTNLGVAHDGEARRITLNRPFARLLGVEGWANTSVRGPDAACLPYTILQNNQVVPADDLPLHRAAREGVPVRDLELDVRLADGQMVHLVVNAAPLFDEQGRTRGAVAVHTDITDRKRAEAELRQSEIRFREAFAHAPIGMVLTGLDGRFLAMNAAYCKLVGRTEAELRGLGFAAVTHPDDVAESREGHRRLLAGEIPAFYMEKRYLHKNGEPVWVRVSATVHRDADGHPVEVVGLIDDITERLRTQAALQDREEMLRTLGDNIPGAIYQAVRPPNGQTRFRHFSAGIQRLLEIAPEEIVADPLALFSRIHPEDLPGVIAAEDEAAQHRRPFDHQFRAWTRSGELRWLHCRSAPHPLADGTLVWDGVVMDITRRKQAEDALREADRRKDEYLAMLAHELRNPLAPIRAANRLLQAHGPADPILVRNREIIDRQVEHMARLLEDLLDVSRITHGLVELRREPLELRVAVRNAVEVCQPLLDERRHQLRVSLPEEPVRVEADRVRLEQILINLLNNAAKYTAPGGGIELRVTPEPSGVVSISIQDNGQGIGPELLPHIFDLFTQGAQGLDRGLGGLGIGLTMVKRLVELHGGTIAAHSAGAGQGSEFTVRLPMLDSEESRVLSHTDVCSTPNHIPCANPNPQSSRVLVVDDNRDGAETLRDLLELWGYQAEATFCGRDALEQVSRHHPNLVLLDLGMSEMDGYEVARRLRAGEGEDCSGARLVLVALTGYGRHEDRERTRAAGFDYHLTKPVDPDTLQHLLSTFLGNGNEPR